jgi:large subunit ribosomal protein L13
LSSASVKLTGKTSKKDLIAIPTVRWYPRKKREKMLEEKPEDLVLLAVKGMLPKNRLSRRLVTKLKVYAGPEHPHEAQKPQPLAIQG